MSSTYSRLPSPAILAQDAVRRFPRWALLTLCFLYISAGFVGREPWRYEDLAGFTLLFQVFGSSHRAWILTRLVAAFLLALTFASTWYATYYLAKRDAAQPVPFAFGGEANPADYARAIADGALLALLACLGLAQLGHETTPALLQLSLTALVFFSLSAYHFRPVQAICAGLIGIAGLITILNTIAIWRFELHQALEWSTWNRLLHMLAWFTWPAWALAVWSIVKWRLHWIRLHPAAHIAIPLAITLLHGALLPFINEPDRWFLSALPTLAALAAFALPTLKRSMKSLIDLFTLIFFSGCALIIWVVWVAMQTGIPAQPLENVHRLLPAFIPSFSAPVMLLALVATVGWAALVRWRLGQHRPGIWMSLVLPAAGATLCWLLLTSLWLPLLNHARSYQPLMQRLEPYLSSNKKSCLMTEGLNTAQLGALKYYTGRTLIPASQPATCSFLIVDAQAAPTLHPRVAPHQWELIVKLRRPSDKVESWLIYSRKP